MRALICLFKGFVLLIEHFHSSAQYESVRGGKTLLKMICGNSDGLIFSVDVLI